MRIALYGEPARVQKLSGKLQNRVELVEADPEVVVALGGDGTFLAAERKYPGVPKCAWRDGNPCRACVGGSFDQVISRLLAKEYRHEQVRKVEGRAGGALLLALNEVHIHSADPRHALRFSVCVEGFACFPIVGDGVLLSTRFGSTGYYRSVTRETLDIDFGLAFINATHPLPPQKLHHPVKITVTITRGPALLLADNDPQQILLQEGEEAVLTSTDHIAAIIRFPSQ